MATVGESVVFPDPRDDKEKDLFQTLLEFIRNVTSIINGGLRFEDNVDCKLVSYTSNAAPNTQDSVAHGLGKTPIGFLVYDRDKDSNDPYRSATFDATNLYLKCSTASVAFKIIVF